MISNAFGEEKVKAGLRCLAGKSVCCKDCPYSDERGFGRHGCMEDCAMDAIELIDELVKGIHDKQAFVKQRDKRYKPTVFYNGREEHEQRTEMNQR